MKRIAIIILSGLILAGTLSAQAAPGGNPPPAAQAPQATKVEGKLALVNGLIAIQAKDKTYYVRGLQHLIGFIDGLKEGAAVKAEGYVRAIPVAPEYAMMELTKLSFNGRDFDLSQMPGRGFGPDGKGMGRGRGMGGNGGSCGNCDNQDDRDDQGPMHRGRR